jgi:phosphate transport system permease protein
VPQEDSPQAHSSVRLARQDAAFHRLSQLFALLVLAMLTAIVVSLAIGAAPAFHKFGLSFLSSTDWNPVTEQFGGFVPIFGTLVTSAIALLIAIPLSFGVALFLTELCPVSLRTPLGIVIELLAAVPSIIYGMWGLFVLAPFLAEHVQPLVQSSLGQVPGLSRLFEGPPMGIGILTAGIILAFMVLPFIAAVMRDVFQIVPSILKESAYAMGCTTWEVVLHVVLPYTKAGVVGGVMLGLGRALGETMAVTFVIGNSYDLSMSLFSPGNSIASSLANEFAEAHSDMHASALIALGLLLFVITLTVLAVAKLLLLRVARREGSRT